MGTHIKSGPGCDTGVTAILDSIRRVVRVLRVASREAERRVGLSGAQLFVLQSLAEAGALSLNELAARTRTHQSSVSVVVQRLAERGLVTRGHSSTDARRLRLSLTARARALLGKAPDVAQGRLIQALERMPMAQRTQLAGMLERLVDELGVAEQSAFMFFEDDGRARVGHGAAKGPGQRAHKGTGGTRGTRKRRVRSNGRA